MEKIRASGKFVLALFALALSLAWVAWGAAGRLLFPRNLCGRCGLPVARWRTLCRECRRLEDS